MKGLRSEVSAGSVLMSDTLDVTSLTHGGHKGKAQGDAIEAEGGGVCSTGDQECPQ